MDETYESARELIGRRYLVTLLRETKGYRFKNPRPLSAADVRYWAAREPGLCLGLWLRGTGLCVLDCDSEPALREAEKRGWVSTLAQQTWRGAQHVFKLPPHVTEPRNRIAFLPQTDLICNNAVPVPPSVIGGFRRCWAGPVPPANDLPVLPSGIWREPVPRPKAVAAAGRGDDFSRALRYARSPRTPGAVSGQGGHNRTFWLGNRLLVLFPGLTFDQLVCCLEAFNEKCQPPWGERELVRKASECWKSQRG